MVETAPIADITGVNEIPSDTKSPLALDFAFQQDVFLRFTDIKGETDVLLPTIRFRRYAGGGPFPLIAEELSILPEAFMQYQGQIPPGYKNRQKAKDLFPSYVDIIVKVGKNPDESRYIIKGIPDGDANPNDNNKFLDIEITKDGNAIVAMRDTRRNNQASVEFKTAENGGKYPIMAEVFTRISERIAKAKKSRRH